MSIKFLVSVFCSTALCTCGMLLIISLGHPGWGITAIIISPFLVGANA